MYRNKFSLTVPQRKAILTIWGISTGAYLVFSAMVVAMSSSDATTTIGLIASALVAGALFREGFKRGWSYYNDSHSANPLAFTKDVIQHNLGGFLWRLAATFVGGRFIANLLAGLSDTLAGKVVWLTAGLALMFLACIGSGLQFGWTLADKREQATSPAAQDI